MGTLAMVRLALLLAAMVALAAAECMPSDGKHLGPSGPCPPKKNVTAAAAVKRVIPDAGVPIKGETCGVMLTSNPECGNQTVTAGCGMCTRGNGSFCASGNMKGPDDKAICCEVWRYDGFAFDYNGECKNERAVTNGIFNHGTHAHYMNAWDPVEGCKEVAYKLSVVAQAAYGNSTASSARTRNMEVAEQVYDKCAASIVPRKGTDERDLKMCDKVKKVLLDEGVGVFTDLGRFCLSLLAAEREAVSRSLYQIKPWPKQQEPSCKLNCGPYGTRNETGCACNCLGNWKGEKCNQCPMSLDKCGKQKAVERFETRFCKCVCKMPYVLDRDTGACANTKNMTRAADFAPGENLKNDMTINQNVFAPYVPVENGGKGTNVTDMKTARS